FLTRGSAPGLAPPVVSFLFFSTSCSTFLLLDYAWQWLVPVCWCGIEGLPPRLRTTGRASVPTGRGNRLVRPAYGRNFDQTSSGKTSVLYYSTFWSIRAGSPVTHFARTHAPSCERWSRCRAAISHSSTVGLPPNISAARSRIGCIRSALARIASSVSHELVAM